MSGSGSALSGLQRSAIGLLVCLLLAAYWYWRIDDALACEALSRQRHFIALEDFLPEVPENPKGFGRSGREVMTVSKKGGQR